LPLSLGPDSDAPELNEGIVSAGGACGTSGGETAPASAGTTMTPTINVIMMRVVFCVLGLGFKGSFSPSH